MIDGYYYGVLECKGSFTYKHNTLYIVMHFIDDGIRNYMIDDLIKYFNNSKIKITRLEHKRDGNRKTAIKLVITPKKDVVKIIKQMQAISPNGAFINKLKQWKSRHEKVWDDNFLIYFTESKLIKLVCYSCTRHSVQFVDEERCCRFCGSKNVTVRKSINTTKFKNMGAE